MLTFSDIKPLASWMAKGLTLNRVVVILFLALFFDVIFSDTYTSKQNYIQILKQLEKLEADPTDFKYSDIEGLYGICRDIRYQVSKELTQDETDKAKLDKGCEVISEIFDSLPQKRVVLD